MVDAENMEHSLRPPLGSWKHNQVLYTFVQITMGHQYLMWQAKNTKRVCAIDLEPYNRLRRVVGERLS